MHRHVRLLRSSLRRPAPRFFATSPDVPPQDSPPTPKIRRTRLSVSPPSTSSSKDPEPLALPDSLSILWSHHPPPHSEQFLPPPEVLQAALNNLLISLHPQTQHRAAFPSPLGPPTEPTLALYCPIEGGDYIIDATVRELARQTRAEVLVLDAVHLAAGEWGHFGPAANSLSLPRNPLHFSSPSQSSSPTNPDTDDGTDEIFPFPRRVTLTLIPQAALHHRTMLASPSARRNGPPSKIKVFFDTLVNLPSDPTSSQGCPRLIYVRDFPTLASTSSFWYPPLLAAVRARRRGPIARPSSPVCNPMSIIFGITPSLTPLVSQSSPPTSSMLSLLAHRSPATHIPAETKSGRSAGWGEDDAAQAAREKRLRERLRKWDKSEALLLEEMPLLSTSPEPPENEEDRPDVIVVGNPVFSPLHGLGSPSAAAPPEADTPFFRTSVLVPKTRSLLKEREARIARRREINELTMRMGVGAAGGALEQENASAVFSDVSGLPEADIASGPISQETSVASSRVDSSMWEEWGSKVEAWANVRQIADHAIGGTLTEAKSVVGSEEKVTLDSTVVSWSAIYKAWASHRSSKDFRASWLKNTLAANPALEEESEQSPHDHIDKVIECIKNDEDLDHHEQRLLSCIIDTASMPTSFDQVHLPAHTIDSVRTIVSLPLLHPRAFQQGVLKDHAMTGCLLFGPPGTGKTLIVRALAKEAGCRMLAISPSDVMDMYVGEGEKLVKAVFSLARKLSPCVVFLDEIDALFGARVSARDSGGAFAHRGVITEFMQEMDGLKSSREDRVIVIGATNRPFDLDDAVLRRLPRRLLVDLPGKKERAEILKILLRNETLADDVNIEALATKTESFSGSDLKHLCVSAALDAVKERVELPWVTTSAPVSTETVSQSAAEPTTLEAIHAMPSSSFSDEDNHVPRRVLQFRNFSKALTEITPSSSELLGSLTELRRWNDDFGEGRKQKRQHFWGKGRFGFTDKHEEQAGTVATSQDK